MHVADHGPQVPQAHTARPAANGGKGRPLFELAGPAMHLFTLPFVLC
jgi:hypothetical protein